MNYTALNNFTFATFRLVLNPRETVHLPPYKGSTFRGGLGNLFKRTLCVSKDKRCETCLLRAQCAYCYCFETPAKDAEQARSSNWPHPYILEPPPEEKLVYREGEKIHLTLVLIGKGVEFLPYFVFVFDELGRSGIGRERNAYQLERVESISRDGNPVPIYDGETLSGDWQERSFCEVAQEVASWEARAIRVRFLTPTRILFNGRLVRREMSFPIFMSRLAGRISLLSQCHCGGSPEFGDVVEQAEAVRTTLADLRWREPERYSTRQMARMKMGGFVGQAVFEGEMGEFLPLLKLGEHVHVGNLTSFGLGKYVIEELPAEHPS